MKKTLTVLLVATMLVVSGCSAQSGLGGGGATPEADGTATETTDEDRDSGTVRMYLSDERNAIDRFEHLNVTVTAVSFQSAEAEAEADADASANASADADANGSVDADNGSADAAATGNATANASADAEADAEAGWHTREVDERTVDLTRLQGENATRLGNLTVAEGEYAAVRLEVSEVEGTLKSGERVDVKLPSGGLVVNEAFALDADGETDFVFDATVFEAGASGMYILKPVASESGTDRPIRLVEDASPTAGANGSAAASASAGVNANTSGSDAQAGVGANVTAGANASGDLAVEVVEAGLSEVTVVITDAGEPVEDATVAVDGEVQGETDADGRVTVPLPEDPVVDVTVDTGEEILETTLDLEAQMNAGADSEAGA